MMTKSKKALMMLGVLLAIAVSFNVEAACSVSKENKMKCRANSEGMDECGGWMHGIPCSGNVVIEAPDQ